MKYRDLVRKLEASGFVLDHHGGNHDVFVRGTKKEAVPRHKEIPEWLARDILKRNCIQ